MRGQGLQCPYTTVTTPLPCLALLAALIPRHFWEVLSKWGQFFSSDFFFFKTPSLN